ncbi:MAG TPA: SPW repeat protein [Anaerolineales bacterium]|nr:SPW repeat protein [Anaerolineales bacterium]
MNIGFGIWLLLSPFLLGYAAATLALWDALIVGVAILTLAWLRMLRPARSVNPGWGNQLLGAWLAISPFVLGFAASGAAKWNDIAIGLSVIFFTSVGLLNGYTPEA